MSSPFIQFLGTIKPLRKAFASYGRVTAILWFLLAFAIYVSIIYMSSHFAAAGYVNKAAVPFVQDLVHDIRFVANDKLGDTYDIERLRYAIDLVLPEKIERYSKALSELLNDPKAASEPSESPESLKLAQKRKYIGYQLERDEKLLEGLKHRLLLLEKDNLTVSEKEALRPRNFDQRVSFLTTKIHSNIEKNFNAEKVAEFAVVRKEGFFQGGVVINHIFVSHWLWYGPMLISLLCFLGDLIRPTPLFVDNKDASENDGEISKES